MTPAPSSEPDRAEEVDELVVRFLERTESCDESPSAVLEAMCREHPEHADDLRASLDQLGRLGLAAPAGETDAPRIGPYRLGRRLGSGGMGVVHLAWSGELDDEPVALKVLRSDQLNEPGFRERFAREVEAAARLDHPNIVRVVDRRTSPAAPDPSEPEAPYVALEYHRGGTLDRIVRHGAQRVATGADFDGADALHAIGSDADPLALPSPLRGEWWEVATRIVREVARALAHAHARQVRHRDVKPSNVLLTPEGRVLLFDFGLATLPDAGRLTATGAQLGSLPYMSPEALRGSSEHDERSDIYSLGVTAYELLTFRLPFEGKDRDRLGLAIERGGAPPPSRFMRGLSRDVAERLDTVVERALEVDPRERYASADAFAADLTQLLRGGPISARPVSQLTRTARWVRRRPFVAATAALTVVLALGAPILYGLLERQHAQAMGKTLDVAVSQLGGLATAVETVLGSLPEGSLDGTRLQANARLESVDRSLEAIRAAEGNEELLAELDAEQARAISQRLVRCRRKLLLARADALGVLIRNDETLETLSELIANCEADLAKDPDDTHALYHLGLATSNQGVQFIVTSDWRAALERGQAALPIMQRAVDEGHREPRMQSELAATRMVVAQAAAWLGEFDIEREACEAAVAILEDLDPAERDRFDLRRLGNAHVRLAILARRSGDRARVSASYAAARECLEAAIEASPADPLARELMAETEYAAARAAVRASDLDEARESLARARIHLDVLTELRVESQGQAAVRRGIEPLEQYVLAASDPGDTALGDLRAGVTGARELWRAEPGDVARLSDLLVKLSRLANALNNNESLPAVRHEEAQAHLDELIELLDEHGDRLSERDRRMMRFGSHYDRAVARARLSNVRGARADVDVVAELARAEDPLDQRFLADALAELVRAIQEDGGDATTEKARLVDAVAAAIDAGYTDVEEIRTHPAMAVVAEDPRFAELVGAEGR